MWIVAGRMAQPRWPGLEMRVDGHAEGRQALAHQKNIHLGRGCQRLVDASGCDVDVGQATAKRDTRRPLHVLAEGLDRLIEELAVKLRHTARRRPALAGKPPLQLRKRLLQVHHHPVAAAHDRDARRGAAQQPVLKTAGGSGYAAGEPRIGRQRGIGGKRGIGL